MTLRNLTHSIVILCLVFSPWLAAPRMDQPVRAAVDATTLHVRSGGVTTGTCSSWTEACDLQYALSIAAASDTIWVAAGIYKPTSGTDRAITFQLKSGVAIYGGFPATGAPGLGDRDWVTHPTILSGDIDNNDLTDPNGVITDTAHIVGSNSYHVVTGSGVTNAAVLDGFTITGGNASAYNGGGMVNDGGSPTLANLAFTGNSATSGGGMVNANNSNPILDHVTFSSNTAVGGDGGGMDSHAGCNPVLDHVTFYSNTATLDGGGMSSGASNPMLTNVTFSGNRAARNGGGLYNWQSSPTLTNTTFISNTATSDGGGMYNWQSGPVLTNVTFYGNAAGVGRYGGAIVNYFNSSPSLANCVLWGDTPNEIANSTDSSLTATYSDIQGGYSGTGNLDADPLFEAAVSGNLHLRLDSPAIEAGDNTKVSGVTTDLDGNPRISGDRVDMGAYEFQYPEPPSPIYVDASATGARDGGDWENALHSLPFALAWAGVGVTEYGLPGMEIWVAAGVYKPTVGADRWATFQLHSGVAVYGGFANSGSPGFGDRDWDAYVTVLSGDIDDNDITDPNGVITDTNHIVGSNSFHLVTGNGVTQNAVLDGFTITGGTAPSSDYGGGMVNDAGSPTLANLIFSGNTARYGNGGGGGMYNHDSSPTLIDCTFQNNYAYRAGGMYNVQSSPVLTRTHFLNNQTITEGGGMRNEDHSSPVLTDCTFSGNGAPWHGGGMDNTNFSSPTLTGCTFLNNVSTLDGGGMWNVNHSNPILIDSSFRGNTAATGGGVFNASSSPVLTRTHFFTNTATNGGGMVNDSGSPTLVDSSFSGNVASNDGGGLYNVNSSTPTLTDCSFTGNTAATGGGVFNASSSSVLTRTHFFTNTATNGGGMKNEDNSNPRLSDCIFSSNTAVGGDGGGMDSYLNCSPVLDDVTFISNTSTIDGGGMSSGASNPTLNNVTFRGNTADGNGGGLFAWQSVPTLTGVDFSGNTATSGGGMYNDHSSPTLVNANFISNTATFGGGAIYNKDCSGINVSSLVNVLFNNNAVTGTTGNEGYGGAMYNEGSSPELVNVTFGNNTATQYGGGMANFDGTEPSAPQVDNSVLWANISGSGTPEEDQLYDTGSSGAIVGSTCTIESSQTQASPFVDADGGDNIPGTADDDFHLVLTSDAIDGGDASLSLLVDSLDLDGDGNTTEELPFDLAGHIRRYADENLDGLPDPVGAPYSDRSIDQGAYEAGCYAWHMHYGAGLLVEGQKYRLDFHDEIDDPSTVTITDTLASYAAERAAGNLSRAKVAYELAMDCAATVTETNQAIEGLLKVIWEQATGAMLEGNEQMVTALDLTDTGGMGIEITALETAIGKYTEATDGYMLPLTGMYQDEFMAAMGISRTQQITYTAVITQVDVQRLAAASARKSQATLELAERHFRSGDRTKAEETLRQGKAQSTVELVLLKEIWTGVVEDVNYHTLLRSLSDMDRLLGFLMAGKNALGYSPEWIPIHYRPGIDVNNYLRVNELAEEKLADAQIPIAEAAIESQKVHDNYIVMQQRYNDIDADYDDELMLMCGVDDGEPDWQRCGGGTIATQISAVEQAQLRLGRVLEQMDVLNKKIQIEVEARAKVAGIYDATAELINPDTSEKYSTLVEQETEIALGWKIAKGVGGFVSNMVSNKATGALAFGKKGVLGKTGGTLAGLSGTIDMIAGLFGVEEEPPKEEKLLEFQAWQNAQMVICDGQVADVDFEKRIKELFLEYGLLDIDYAIALENLHQELLRLDGMKTRVEYLLAEKARAQAFTSLLYQDPGYRVLRDFYMEQAQDSFDTALDYTFRAGRALEYEANLPSADLLSPDPDEMFAIRNIVTLITARAHTKTAYDDWSADKTPQTYVTDDPYPKILLSRALNYEDTEIPGIGPVTAEEQFNAYVIRNPANRYDVDDDGTAESLFFTFDTSVHRGNPFFDHCLFNDRIESVKVRVRGSNLGIDSVTIRLGWGDTGCTDTECGTTFIRSEEAFMTEDPPSSGMYLDDLRAYKVQPKLSTIQAVTGDVFFPLGAANYDLATRSVANPNWTFYIDGTLPANQGFNLDNVDEIELIITHKAYSSQAPMCQGPGTLRLTPSRAYRPMEKILDPQSSPLLMSLGNGLSLNTIADATSLNGFYAGTVVMTSPLYMPALDMNLVLTATGGNLTGYLDAAQSLNVPVVDEATGHGPAISGSWSGESFSLHSEVFTTSLGSGMVITRQVLVHSGVISDSGEILTGVYSETVAGLTPEPMVLYGGIELWGLPTTLGPSASFDAIPVIGPAPLIVTFSDFSSGEPTSWHWSFGDGGTSTEQYPSHIYSTLGTYSVTLTVSNTVGSDTLIKADYINVVEVKPKIYLPIVVRNEP